MPGLLWRIPSELRACLMMPQYQVPLVLLTPTFTFLEERAHAVRVCLATCAYGHSMEKVFLLLGNDSALS